MIEIHLFPEKEEPMSKITRNLVALACQLFFPNQKGGENLLVRVEIGAAHYEIPFRLPRKRDQ
jgi:hypothetical protein